MVGDARVFVVADETTVLTAAKVALYGSDGTGAADVVLKISKALDVYPTQVTEPFVLSALNPLLVSCCFPFCGGRTGSKQSSARPVAGGVTLSL